MSHGQDPSRKLLHTRESSNRMLFLDNSPATVNKVLKDYNRANAIQLNVPLNTYPNVRLCTCKNNTKVRTRRLVHLKMTPWKDISHDTYVPMAGVIQRTVMIPTHTILEAHIHTYIHTTMQLCTWFRLIACSIETSSNNLDFRKWNHVPKG